jgi:hypothetical protein
MFYDEDVGGLGAIHPWTVFRVNAREIEALMPPGKHVGRGEPFLKSWKIRSAKWPERDGGMHQNQWLIWATTHFGTGVSHYS